MRVIEARNVHQALPKALELLDAHGFLRDSRNGPVKMTPWPVTTVYACPTERVLFWRLRDANPFFHLYESLWMLAGRNDVESVARFSKQMRSYSDDTKTFHGAYGYRWRKSFGMDQLHWVAQTLIDNKDDRRAVLQMWNPVSDLGVNGKDFPCNVTAHFQRDKVGRLTMTVFNRSNDILWGCYGANAVHFSVLQEYLAGWIGCEVGPYYQISDNWHAYVNTLLDRVAPLAGEAHNETNPYPSQVHPVPMVSTPFSVFDYSLGVFLASEAQGFPGMSFGKAPVHADPWWDMCYKIFRAHQLYRTEVEDAKYLAPLQLLVTMDPTIDWVCACTAWLLRRYEAWKLKYHAHVAATINTYQEPA